MNEIFDLMHIGKGYTWEGINNMTIYERDMHVIMLANWLMEQKNLKRGGK